MGANDKSFRKGNEHPNFKGGRYINPRGYVEILTEDGYRLEHTLVAEKHFRKVQKDECVHHINGNRSDNRPENLKIMTRAAHSRLHRKGSIVSEETKAKFRAIRKGTQQKESHAQWKNDITKEKIILVIKQGGKDAQVKDISRLLGICSDTLRSRLKHYNLYKVNWHGTKQSIFNG